MPKTPSNLTFRLDYPLQHSSWQARSVVWHYQQRVDVAALATTLGFTVPVTLSEPLRLELQKTGADFRPHLEKLLRLVYRILDLSQTEDADFRFRPRHFPGRGCLFMLWGAASDHPALHLQFADEADDEGWPLDPESPAALRPPTRYHYLDRPLHTAIVPSASAGQPVPGETPPEPGD